MHWHSNWIVRETELETPTPCPICLKDRTTVLFRLSEAQQTKLRLGSEVEAIFKMLKNPKRDIFELVDGTHITLGDLPSGLILDVLVVPGSEHLSTILEDETQQVKALGGRRESLLARLLTHFHRPTQDVTPAVTVPDESSPFVVR
jgi:hypothetical protein